MPTNNLVRLRAWLVLLISLLSAARETIPPTKVDPYVSDSLVMRDLLALPPVRVSVEGVDSGPTERTSVPCLRGKISLPPGQSFADYVEGALTTELALADRYSSAAPVSLSGVLNEVSFSFDRAIGFASFGGTWSFALTLNSSNGETISVTANHSYDTGYAPSRCHIAASYLMPAVQDLIRNLVDDPRFVELLE